MKKQTKIILYSSLIAVAVVTIALVYVYSKKPKCKNKILFLGNSQTANKNSYVEKLEKHCNNNFTKIAKVGAKSDWILEQYQKELNNSNSYDWVSVMIGGNDVFARKSINKTKENLDKLFNLAKKNKSKILVITSPSKINYHKTDAEHLRLTKELEDWLRKNKKVNKFISITKETENPEYMASDNLHLNSKGQNLVFNHLAQNIA